MQVSHKTNGGIMARRMTCYKLCGISSGISIILSQILRLLDAVDRLCPECGEWIVVTGTGNLHCTDDFRTGIFNENELEDLGLLQLKESKKYLKRARAQLKADPPCSPDVVLDREMLAKMSAGALREMVRRLWDAACNTCICDQSARRIFRDIGLTRSTEKAE